MSPEYTKLEEETRKEIDAKLEAAGWVVQNKRRRGQSRLVSAKCNITNDSDPFGFIGFSFGFYYQNGNIVLRLQPVWSSDR